MQKDASGTMMEATRASSSAPSPRLEVEPKVEAEEVPVKNIGKWLRGLVGAFIQSASATVSVMLVDPETFNIETGLGKVGTVALVSGVVGAALFLNKRPLPGWLGGE